MGVLSKKIRAERRSEQQEKKRRAPRGGTRAAQALHTATRKGYRGTPKVLQRKVSAKFY